MKNEIIFSDWDGTASDFPEIFGMANAIITGRSWQEAKDFYEEAGRTDKPVFFNPIATKENDSLKIVIHKAKIINSAKATKYYENVPLEAKQIQLLCPDTKVVLVKQGQTYI